MVKGTFGDDPASNLTAYAVENLGPELKKEIDRLAGSFMNSMEKNTPLHLEFNTIIPRIPPAHRDNIEALIRDLEVAFLHRRYEMLRLVLKDPLPYDHLVVMLDRYCLEQTWVSDPEIPRIAARIVVGHISQWRLMCLLHDKMRGHIEHLSQASSITAADMKHTFSWLGRLMIFLRWVPYEWVEEILLEIIDKIRLKSSVDEIRLCTSVLRAFFCRPNISLKSVTHLCDNLLDRFQDKLPSSLHPLLRAILVSGGDECRRFLEQQVYRNPQRYCTPFFFETMALIDKAETARLLCSATDHILTFIDKVTYINLLAGTGERTDFVADQLTAFWDDNNLDIKLAILKAIDKLHCPRTCSFFIKKLDREDNTRFQLLMLDTIAASGRFDELMKLPGKLAGGHPVLYFHIIDLCHRTLLSEPALLTKLKNYTLLMHFEIARVQIYMLYRFLFNFQVLIEKVRFFVEKADALEIDVTFDKESGFVPLVDMKVPAAKRRRLNTRDFKNLLEEITRLNFRHVQSMALRERLGDILDFASDFNPRYSDDIFGRAKAKFVRAKVLHKDDFTCFRAPKETSVQQQCNDLLERTGNSIAMVQEYFLFKEWFVRRAPFVLHDGLFGLIEKIRRGDELHFNPDAFLEDDVKKDLREIFYIFYECTKQGVYLTDTLLDFLRQWPAREIPDHVWKDLTHRRSQIAREEMVFDPHHTFDRHLQFTTFAHRYRYGKESVDRPSIIYLWLKFEQASEQLKQKLSPRGWPALPPHGEMRTTIGPLVKKMYVQQIDDACALYDFLMPIYKRFHPLGIRIRIIPNITYGLFCLAPILMDLITKGVHVSLAGISSRYCDDMNISEFKLRHDALYPVKPYPFSTASNYGTLNHDRILIVIDGTMEPVHRQHPRKIRLPMAHRGYCNHIAAVNYVRSKYGYEMNNPCRDVASSLGLSERYVRNLVRTVNFEQTVNSLLQNFDKKELKRFHRKTGTGRTYYTFSQWNPDGYSALTGSRGFGEREIPCAKPESITCPTLLFISMNGFSKKDAIPAYFDNNPEVEKSRIIIGPYGVNLDTGWPWKGKGIVVKFPEGENR
ncbi:MAG: hypothetical protein GF401_10070 [Chitinivibrionales bacterium]|nr:hypothetical protein [Chitinivibrionales bacterium]